MPPRPGNGMSERHNSARTSLRSTWRNSRSTCRHESGAPNDINRLIEAVLRRVTLRGFIVRDHEEARPEFERTVSAWLRSGEVTALQTVVDGIENAVDAFLGMLKGGNVGKALVRLDTSWPV